MFVDVRVTVKVVVGVLLAVMVAVTVGVEVGCVWKQVAEPPPWALSGHTAVTRIDSYGPGP